MLRKLPVLLAVGTFSAMLAAGAFATGAHDATTDPAAHDRLHTAPASGGPLQNAGARATGFDATTDPAAHDWLHTAPASGGPLQNAGVRVTGFDATTDPAAHDRLHTAN